MSKRASPSLRAFLNIEQLESRLTPTATYTPVQIEHAYGFDLVPYTGAGQTIAIVDAYDNPNIEADLKAFDAQFGLVDPVFVKATPQGTPKYDAGWATEIALDVEWAHAMAPGAKILLVEAKSSSYADLLAAVNYAANQPGVSVVSMSWGGGEFSAEKTSAYDGVFLNHPGVTFVASSGDSGAPPSWPSISPNVLSVGGTALTLTSAGNYASETGWGAGRRSWYYGGSGGGISSYESKPAYQSNVKLSASKRTNPDVAYDADPNTGFYVYDSNNGGWLNVGGTSAGAPQWAALIALADEGRVAAGKTTLDGATQTIPGIYNLPASDFHDIVKGNNGYAASIGYDLVTGVGTPKANLVIQDLIKVDSKGKVTAAAATTSATKTVATPSHHHVVGHVALGVPKATTDLIASPVAPPPHS